MHTSLLRALGAVTVLCSAVLGAACSDDDASDDAAPGSSTTVSSAPVPTTTTTPPTRLAIVVGAQGLLGWWDGGAWIQATREAATPVEGGEEYTFVRLDEPLTFSSGSEASEGVFLEEFCGTPSVQLSPGFPDSKPAGVPWPVAVHGVEDPRPRDVALLDPGSEVYRAAARVALADLGIEEEEPQLAQVVRADISGDGTDEVLVVVERVADLEGAFAEPGDYSVLLLREVVDGTVHTSVLSDSRNTSTADSPSPYIDLVRVAALADLNGDGTMEVVLNEQYYEGSSTSVNELADGSLEEVLTAGCGV